MAGAAKQIDHNSMDAATADILSHATKLHICSQAPTQYSDVATYTLGSVALSSGAFTQQAGTDSGRQLALAQQTVNGTGSGSGVALVIIDETNQRIKAVTTCNAYTMANGVPVVVPSYVVWEIEDPS
jgi:hypothetical protein